MEQLNQVIGTIALCMGASWASGINLYAAILVLGFSGITGGVQLPDTLLVLTDPLVLSAAGIMYLVEFFTDKIPGVDTGWDALHTFIRIPAGALLAFGATGEVAPPLALAAAIMGGTLAAGTHATKAGTRALINTSPEPFTNWTASITEDIVVIAGVWTALHHPVLYLLLLGLFVLIMIFLLPKLWRGIKHILGIIGRLLGFKSKQKTPPLESDDKKPEETQNLEEKLVTLKNLMEKGLITEEEFNSKKKELLNGEI